VSAEGFASAPRAAPRVVLVRPLHAGNVGSAARAMANMGLGDLRIVAPRYRSIRPARAMAAEGRPVLDGARVEGALGDALQGCVTVIATTARRRRWKAWEVLGPAPAMALAAERGPAAIVFGPEDAGLDNDDLGFATHLCRIPTAEPYSSLNLAQAVLLLSWEWAQRAGPAARPPSGIGRARPGVQAVDGTVRQAADLLDRVSYFRGRNRAQVEASLKQVLVRGDITETEIALLRGAMRRVAWRIEHPGAPLPDNV
jgi:tRNA/rRNA methyltransferase